MNYLKGKSARPSIPYIGFQKHHGFRILTKMHNLQFPILGSNQFKRWKRVDIFIPSIPYIGFIAGDVKANQTLKEAPSIPYIGFEENIAMNVWMTEQQLILQFPILGSMNGADK